MNAKPGGDESTTDGTYNSFSSNGFEEKADDGVTVLYSDHKYIKHKLWPADLVYGKETIESVEHHSIEPVANGSINVASKVFQQRQPLVVGDYILITYSVVKYNIDGTDYNINGLWKVLGLGAADSKWKLVRADKEWDWKYAMFKCTNTFQGVDYSILDENQQYFELKGTEAVLEYKTDDASYKEIITNKISDIAGEAISDDNFSSKYKNSSGQLYKISVVPFEDYADNTSELRLVINNTLIYSGTDAEMKEVEEPVNSGLYRKQMEKIFFSTQRDIIIDGEFVSGINDLTMDFKLELLSVLNQ